MWHAMFAEQIPLAEKILRTVIVYALITVLFRLTGKRGLASMNTFDFVVIFLLSNVVQNAVIGNDTSLIGGMIGAITLVTVNELVNRLIAASPTAARIFDGRATTVIRDGRVVEPALRRLGMRRSEIDHAVRLENGDDVSEIEVGRLEPGGQLVLTLKATEQAATKADIAELTSRLGQIEHLLGARSTSTRTSRFGVGLQRRSWAPIAISEAQTPDQTPWNRSSSGQPGTRRGRGRRGWR